MSNQITIVIVDDDKDQLFLMKMLLEERYRVITSDSIEKTVDLFKSNTVHVLISDYCLGDKNANDLIESLGNYKPKLCILVTGIDNITANNFDISLHKPIDIPMVESIIEESRNSFEKDSQ